MRLTTIIVFTCLLGLAHNLSSQNKVIDLWKGEVPGAIHDDNYKQTVDSADNWIKMKFVTKPIMDMYQAPLEKATGTAVIVCPGGGYSALAIAHEGKEIALWLNSLGITAFVLKYRLPHDDIMVDKSVGPIQDAQKAMRMIRQHAKEWNIHPRKIGVIGFSAGGHLASTLSTHFKENVYDMADTTSARPDFSVLIYPVITMDAASAHMGSRENLLGKDPSSDRVNRFSNELHVNRETPPAFLVHSIDDEAVPVQNSINYAMALRKHEVPCELHVYQSGGHGYGLGRSRNTESSWPEACRKWLEARGFLSVPSR
jgi:acetyl esterase/lipase